MLISCRNRDDGTIFIAPNITSDAAVLAQALRPLQLTDATANAALSLYPLSKFEDITSENHTATAQYMRAAQIFRDVTFTCPSIFLAEAMYNYSDVSTTTSYLFENNVTAYTTLEKDGNVTYLGVIHSSDLAFVFDDVASSAYNASLLGGIDQSDVTLGSDWSASWAQFANDGSAGGKNGTFQEWSQITRAQGNETSVLIGEVDVMFIGGLQARMTTTSDASGALANEDLVQRCAFWNDEKVQRELQV